MLKTPLITAYKAETHLTKKREGKDDRQRPRDWFLTKRTNSVADESLLEAMNVDKTELSLPESEKKNIKKKNGAKLKCQGLGV